MQRVLIVDDIPDNLYFLEVLLKGNGFEVASALNGTEALLLARETVPALIISDILMPVMDGYTLCREWRCDERLKSIPFIFYTATFTEKRDEELALSLGADRFLIKPMEPEGLMAVIRDVLAGSTVNSSTSLPDDTGMLKEYSEALFRKLEKKMADLEQANRELEQSIVEQKKLEEQLRQAQKMEAIGRFSAGIAHDFNNILTVIIGYGGIMRMKSTLADGERDKLDHILNAADRAINLTGSLLAFSRKQPVKLQLLDLNNAVSGVETLLRRVVGDDIILSISPASDKIPIMADRGHIEQVLMNLAVNSHDAMPQGGTLSVETKTIVIDEAFIRMHGYGTPGCYALLSVSDTGVGMDSDTIQHIFEPFFTTKEPGRGTGLGLAIVYGIILQHNGHIHVYSEPGQGTAFRILLPLTVEEAGIGDVAPSYVKPPGGSETILVVDNEESIREYLNLFLTTLGYTVYQASDGREAVTRYREIGNKVDLVLMDVIMPRKNGPEAALEIRGINENARILFISGYPYDVINERHLLNENALLVMKPLAPSELALKVREILDR
ncbi:MAG: response regulator [Desulfuromonadaceae bacterium]|nr:response regulator [Desulfuromonadaceae bacterium]MDD5104931.1 response regulator [Desulfuromonadaceae bacterium]